MILKREMLDYTQKWNLPVVLLFTGNPVLNRYGGIVMGRGAARMCRDKYYGIDLEFGKIIKQNPGAHLMFTQIKKRQVLGWFKVKHHWQDQADIGLIQESTNKLIQLANRESHCDFHMNYPGIGNGRLIREDVEPILQQLPDNVFLYEV
jgi:hypothetical protein